MKDIKSTLFKLSKNKMLLSLQEASISLLPVILTITFVLLASHLLKLLPENLEPTYLINSAQELFNFFYVVFPLLFSISLSTALSRTYEIEPIIINLISITLLIVTTVDKTLTYANLDGNIYFQILPIPINLVVVAIFRYLIFKKSILVYKTSEFGIGLRRQLNSIIPAIISFCIVYALLTLLIFIDNYFELSTSLVSLSTEDINNITNYLIEKTVRGVTWFLGINPNHILGFVVEPLREALDQNTYNINNGLTPKNIITYNYHIFSDIGGAGSVMCLIISVFIVSNSEHNKKIAKFSLIPSTFNISEVIHYGMPIVFNPFLFLPFVLVPIVSGLITYFFMWLGWLSPITNSVPWMIPPLINSYLSTGDYNAIIIQLINLFIGISIYIPFLKLSEGTNRDVNLSKTFSNSLNLESKNIQSVYYKNQQTLLESINKQQKFNDMFWEVSIGTLLLYYQPIICIDSKDVIKVEALIRLKDKEGNVKGPFFIDALSEAGLSKDFDIWVLNRVVHQSKKWNYLTPNATISINISPDSLLDITFIDLLIEQSQIMRHQLSIEILETSIIFEEEKINEHLELLRENNIKVFLDDFGSGFSGLAMLPKINLDGVKYDMAFSNQLNDDKNILFVKKCLDVSKNLNHQIILEGVETESQYKKAIELGINHVQGYYFSKPLPPDEVIKYINNSLSKN